MGFRSTLISQDVSLLTWPGWFRQKYADLLPDDGGTVLRSDHQQKTCYRKDLPGDVHAALTEQGWFGELDRSFVFVWLHDCGGVTRVQVNAAGARIAYPTEWGTELTELMNHPDDRQESMHGYHCCGACSDVREPASSRIVLDGQPIPEITG